MDKSIIKSWNYEVDNRRYNLTLWEDKLVQTYSYNNSEYKNEYDPIEHVRERRSITATSRIQFELYKLITASDCPSHFTPIEQKRWQFWQAIDATKIVVKELFMDEEKTDPFPYNQYELLTHYSSCQSFESFFFYGSRRENLPLETRRILRRIILEALDPNKHQLSFKDAFPLFDYNNIIPLKWEYTSASGYGESLSLYKGSIVIASWEPNPKNCGGASYPIEMFWCKLDQNIPSSFKQYIPDIQASLELALISNFEF